MRHLTISQLLQTSRQVAFQSVSDYQRGIWYERVASGLYWVLEIRRWRRVALTMEAISHLTVYSALFEYKHSHIFFVDDGVRYEDNPDKIVVPHISCPYFPFTLFAIHPFEGVS